MTISELKPGDIVRLRWEDGLWLFTGQHPYGGVESRYMMVRLDQYPLELRNFDEDQIFESVYEHRFATHLKRDEMIVSIRIVPRDDNT